MFLFVFLFCFFLCFWGASFVSNIVVVAVVVVVVSDKIDPYTSAFKSYLFKSHLTYSKRLLLN